MNAYWSALADHLWQSTVFAVFAGLLTLAFRKNRARVRHWMWVAASGKFLLPIGMLIAIGSHFELREATVPPSVSVVMEGVSQPFTGGASAPLLATAPADRNLFAAVLLSIWACGFVGISCSWWIRWRRARAAVRAGAPVRIEIPIRSVCSPTFFEPGVFGGFLPVLLLPEGIFDRLTSTQLEAVIEHELCHVRHRDNFIASLQMFVEAVFWFHPLVWWIGRKMVEERERGCDEEVLSRGREPRVYAEAILSVCKLYVESPIECVAGVTGANLKERIEGILRGCAGVRLSVAKKAALAGAGLAAVTLPFVVGVMHGQATTENRPKFEIASVKAVGSGDGALKSAGGRGGRATTELEHRRLTLRLNLYALIVNAYGLRGCPPFGEVGGCTLLSGGPDWLRKDVFEIVAKMPEDSPDYTSVQFVNLHAPELQLMLQGLLADRFALKVHHETKELPVYALTVGKKGPKFKRSDSSEEPRLMFHGSVQPNGPKIIQLIVQNGSMQELVELYAKFMDRPVVDRTGLKDRYDFTLDYEENTDAQGAFGGLTGPTLFKAFEAQVGLKWEATKGAVEILVIDHAEKPSAN